MKPEAWAAELKGSLIAAEANVGALYDHLLYARHPDGRYLSHAFTLALCYTEHRYGMDPDSIEARHNTASWGMRRSKANPIVEGVAIHTPRGQFVQYRDWLESLEDCAYALTHPGFVYQQEKRETIAAVIARWSPNGDFDNNAERRTATIAKMMDRLAGRSTMARIALAAGHHNTDGGNPFEYITTGWLTPAIAAACRTLGMDVRVVQGSDIPSGDFKGGIWDVARQVVKWHEEGWTPDIFLETHTQGVGDTNVRGVFGIYPDWGTDVDTDARDRLIPDAARRISKATGIPVWASGLMSEKRTGVGIGGSRLGILNKTAPLAATTTRLLIEYGAHSNPDDAKIHRTDAFYQRAAQATAEAFAAFLGLPAPPIKTLAKPPAPRPEGWLGVADKDSFAWEGEGVIVERWSRWYNPEKRKFYHRKWAADNGYEPWVEE